MGILPGEAPLEKNWKNSQANKDRLLGQFLLQNIQGKKMEEMKVLNIYKLNIYQVLTFIFRIKRDTTPAVF